MIVVFWVSLLIILYTFIGYGFVLFLLIKIKRLFYTSAPLDGNLEFPKVTILIAAYNEEEIVEAKVENTLGLDYPHEKNKLFL
ncbi:hypothetical protein [Pedobacter steynii]